MTIVGRVTRKFHTVPWSISTDMSTGEPHVREPLLHQRYADEDDKELEAVTEGLSTTVETSWAERHKLLIMVVCLVQLSAGLFTTVQNVSKYHELTRNIGM